MPAMNADALDTCLAIALIVLTLKVGETANFSFKGDTTVIKRIA